MEAGEYGLARGTCFVARCLEVVADARAAVDIVVCFGWGGFFCVIYVDDFFFLRTDTACCKYEAALPHLPLY